MTRIVFFYYLRLLKDHQIFSIVLLRTITLGFCYNAAEYCAPCQRAEHFSGPSKETHRLRHCQLILSVFCSRLRSRHCRTAVNVKDGEFRSQQFVNIARDSHSLQITLCLTDCPVTRLDGGYVNFNECDKHLDSWIEDNELEM